MIHFIYQSACGNDPCDTLLPVNRYGGIAAGKNVGTLTTGFKNYMTLRNSIYVYSSGPFGNDAPLPPDTIYGLMTGVNGFKKAQIDTCEDLFTLVTFNTYTLKPDSQNCVVSILTTSRDDPTAANLKQNVDNANAFMNAHPEVKCCGCTPGDANGDGQVNVGDAVYLISFVFKGGPYPTPYAVCSGDANGDCQCNVGDAVYIISYVFKGGTPPVNCAFWKAHCGVIRE